MCKNSKFFTPSGMKINYLCVFYYFFGIPATPTLSPTLLQSVSGLMQGAVSYQLSAISLGNLQCILWSKIGVIKMGFVLRKLKYKIQQHEHQR